MHTVNFEAMGSKILIAMDTEDPEISNQVRACCTWFDGWEQILSRFRITSELSNLNQFAGQPIIVSSPLWDVLNLSLQTEQRTDGLVTPLVLNALEAAGYDRTFDEIIQNIDQMLRESAPQLPINSATIKMNVKSHEVTIPAGHRIDLGGVVKGWAAHQAMARLSEFAPTLVDAGGDIAVSGPQRNGDPWPIGIENPFEPIKDLDLLMIPGGGVATSGRDYRRWKMAGKWMHHIIDPRTNQPAETDLLSVTVISKDVMTAEAATKTALILGSRDAIPWLNAQDELHYLLVPEEGDLIHSNHFTDYQWSESWSTMNLPK